MTAWCSLLRLTHWSKGVFVLLGALYAGASQAMAKALLAMLAFCFVSSAVYIYNDLRDREADALHPQKSNRPLARGEISPIKAVCVLIGLLLLGLSIGRFISTALLACLGTYLLINLAYNQGLRCVPILDVACIAAGFMLRVLAGTVGIGLPPSWWLMITTVLLSLYIALSKRRIEKVRYSGLGTRPVLDKYPLTSLDKAFTTVGVATFIVYLGYVFLSRHESFYFLLTLPFAAIGLWRFAWLSRRESGEDDPLSLFFNDMLSCLNGLCFLILTLIALLP